MIARNKLVFVAISALVVLFLVILTIPERSVPVVEPAPPWYDNGASNKVPGYGDPDQFFAYHAAIRRAEGGPGYPPNYRMEAFGRAVAARKQPGKKLAWVERGPANVPGRTRAVIVDPDDPSHRTWFAGSVSGGLWKTVDGGTSWQSLTDHLPNLAVTALAMAPSDPNVIYMGTGEGFGNVDAVAGSGIFRSTDRGRTWVQLVSTVQGSAFRFVNRMVVDPDDAQTVVVATNEGIFRTSDGGGVWDRVYRYERGLKVRKVQDLRARPDDFDVQFATVNGYAILRSMDAGRTWDVSLDDFIEPVSVRRMELAIAPSAPSVVYASGEFGIGNDRLYRTGDGGQTWNKVLIDGKTDWLGFQGFYDQTLAVHPYEVDRLLLGGVWLAEASVGTEIREKKYLLDFLRYNTRTFLDFWAFGGNFGTGSAGYLQTGDEVDEVLDVTPDDFVSMEIRFGPGRSQKAHRYTVSATSNKPAANKLDLPFAEYEYQDYTDVPFEVWDIDNNRQLMVSFRDQADDGEFSLVPFRVSGPKDSLSWEVVAVHGYSYNVTVADERLARDGGLVNKLLYYLVPTLVSGAVWDPENLPVSYLRITVDQATFLSGKTDSHPANCCVHVDHHNLIFIPVNEARGEFKLLNANDGGVYFSDDSGETFTGATGYNTSQFYGVDKKPGENVYIGGTQDNGTWRSDADPLLDDSWEHVLGGDGFDAVWHARDVRLVLAGSQGNGIARSTDGGKSFTHVEKPDDYGPFQTVLSNSRDVPDRVFAIGGRGVWRSEDFGAHWHIIPIPKEQWGFGSGKVRVSLASADVVWAGNRLDNQGSLTGTMHVSLDGGQTFMPTTVPDIAPEASISGLATHPNQDSTAYVLFSAYGRPKILHTTDLGQSWRDLSGFAGSPGGESTNGFPDVAVYDLLVMPHDPDVIWAGTEIGLFESTDGGESWDYADNGLPAVSVWQIKLVDDQVILATHGRGIWTLDVPGLLAGAGYGPALGSDFVFFASGTNTRIEAFDGSPVPDPFGSGSQETVLRYDAGPYRSFRFARDLGVDLTSNIASGDLLHLRLLLDPRVPDRDQGSPALVLEDKTDDSRAEDGSADLPFRVTWRIPEELRDGRWHELAIPLPPTTWRDLENARAQGRLGGLAQHWHYNGAATAAGLRVSTDGRGLETSERPELWKEFEWGNVRALGIVWESDGGGPVWVDDVYIGQPGLDLSIADAPVQAMSGVTVSKSLLGNVIAWDPNPLVRGRNVYASTDLIRDVTADGVFLLQYFSQSATATSLTHRLEVPHPSLVPHEIHYAVTSLSAHGVENQDVSASSGVVNNPLLPVTPAIVELTDREAERLRANFFSLPVLAEGFPEWLEPFRVDVLHSSPGESGRFPERDDELSGAFWIGQSTRNELFVYAEVNDDVISLAGESVSPDDAWQYDGIEMGWGNYDVRDVEGGSLLTGSPHVALERGAHADYHFRIVPHADGSAAIYRNAGTGAYVPVPGSNALHDTLEDASGNHIGWKVLVSIPLDAIQNVAEQDIVLAPVTGTDLRLVPMNLALNDADETGKRDNQIQWSTKHNANGRWWHTPAQWQVVAMVGRATWTGVDDALTELPVTFSLDQNYPNPFNPATTIAFSLASDEPVTLTVYNALGRRVAILLDGKTVTRGSHTVRFDAQGLASGVYFYQLKAGDAYLNGKRMMLVK